jgi:hypothetical protein
MCDNLLKFGVFLCTYIFFGLVDASNSPSKYILLGEKF